MTDCKPISSCPTCGDVTEHLVSWEFSGLGDSIFNYTAEFHYCPSCGLVYISNISDGTLGRFYENECGYSQKAHFCATAPENIRKFEAYRRVLVEAGLQDCGVADIGCGRGGFLHWLAEGGWNSKCHGVDMDLRSIKEGITATGNDVTFCKGAVWDLPFGNETQPLLTYFHVLEHIRDLSRLLAEANRVLRPGGHILIDVPDGENFDTTPVGTAFWPAIREHVNHFSAASLCRALARNGFGVQHIIRQELPTPEFSYPSLMVLAQKGVPSVQSVGGSAKVATHIANSRQMLRRRADELCLLKRKHSKLTFWGCASVLFSLLPMLTTESVAICDASSEIQQTTWRGLPIHDPTETPIGGALIIVPYLHGDEIRTAARTLGWPEPSVFRLW